MSAFQLPNGAGAIPAIGLGTFLSERREVGNAVEYAVLAGYRHLDLAFIYGNQNKVGIALRKVIPSVVKREELFITTKLWNSSHHPKDVEGELDLSLKQLGLEYLDLYLMHWPVALKTQTGPEIDTSVTVAETWVAMCSLLKTGKVRNIGVSNFTVDHLERLIAATGIKPAVNQVELHPSLHQDDLLEYCKREGIHVTAYLPIGGQATKKRPSLLDHPTVKEVARSYPEATPAQILLNWGLARGYSVIPKSVKPERIRSNLRELRLKSKDLDRIADIGKNNQRRFVVPATSLGWKIDVFGTPEEQVLSTKVLVSHQARL